MVSARHSGHALIISSHRDFPHKERLSVLPEISIDDGGEPIYNKKRGRGRPNDSGWNHYGHLMDDVVTFCVSCPDDLSNVDAIVTASKSSLSITSAARALNVLLMSLQKHYRGDGKLTRSVETLKDRYEDVVKSRGFLQRKPLIPSRARLKIGEPTKFVPIDRKPS